MGSEMCIRDRIPDEANVAAELDVLLEKGYDEQYIFNRLRFFGGNFEDIQNLTRKISGKTKKEEA